MSPDVENDLCAELLKDLAKGTLTFLFTVDKLSEGLDLPEINTVLFLRPTESLTVFLQQLGRGLRHAPEKDCLTVIDLVGQAHRRYRIDTKLKALLPKHQVLNRPGSRNGLSSPARRMFHSARQLSRTYVLENIRENLKNLSVQIPDRLQTFAKRQDQKLKLTFGNFVRHYDYEPELLLAKESWTGWKAKAQLAPIPTDPESFQVEKDPVARGFYERAKGDCSH